MTIRSVKNKMSIAVSLCVLLTALIIIWVAAGGMRSSANNMATEKSLSVARAVSADLGVGLSRDLQVVQTLASTLTAVRMDDEQPGLERQGVLMILHHILAENQALAGIYTCWEPDAFDGKDEEQKDAGNEAAGGRFALYLHRGQDGQVVSQPLLSLAAKTVDGNPGDWYAMPQQTGKIYVGDPQSTAIGGRKTVVMTLAVPIMVSNTFRGVVGVDIDLATLQNALDALQNRYHGIKASLISSSGILAAVSGMPELSGEHMQKLHPDYEEDIAYVQRGEEVNMVMGELLDTYTPIRIGDADATWSVNILVPMADFSGSATAAMWKMVLIAIVCVIGALVILRKITSGVVGQLERVSDLAAGLAEGDLSRRLNIHQDDEIGTLAVALDQSCNSMSSMIREINNNAQTQASAAQEMSSVSSQLAATSEEMNVQAESVAGATEQMSVSINAMASASEEMSVNIQTVSSTAEQMSTNMNSIATSVEQMSTSIEDVALNARDGSIIAKQAMDMSESATRIMDVLGKAAKEIGEVTSLIKRIADQTNLLALNATIEAASAGDAGKGFAVVANEIKELANQSGQAANEIAKRVKGVQGNASGAVEAITNITEIIQRINDASMVISRSVEEQTSTALEISDSVQQATAGISNIANSIAELARGANDVSKSAAEAARGVTEVSANIQGLSRAASETNSGAQQVNQTAAELARISSQLREVSGRFKV